MRKPPKRPAKKSSPSKQRSRARTAALDRDERVETLEERVESLEATVDALREAMRKQGLRLGALAELDRRRTEREQGK
jgi:SMC interacting uncharacterized protein involved in chromosome segregation